MTESLRSMSQGQGEVNSMPFPSFHNFQALKGSIQLLLV